MNVPKVIVVTQAELDSLIAETVILPHQLYYIAEVTVGEVTTPAKLMYGKSSSVLHMVAIDSVDRYTNAEIDTMIGDIETVLAGI